MAAMAQLDCGACGYLCKTYSEAIARGRGEETSTDARPAARRRPASSRSSSPRRRDAPTNGTVAMTSLVDGNGPASGHANGSTMTAVVAAAGLQPLEPVPGPADREPAAERGRVRQKDTRHVMISLAGSGLSLQAGRRPRRFPRELPRAGR